MKKNDILIKHNTQYFFFFLTFLMMMFTNQSLQAHESRPVYIKVEKLDSIISIEIKIPNTVSLNNLPILILPDGFELDKQFKQPMQITNAGYIVNQQYLGNQTSLKGEELQLLFPQYNPSITTILQYEEQKAAPQIIVNGPKENIFKIKKEGTRFETALEYTFLGIEHIWAGIDHLLFIACLLFIAGFSRKLLITITGFTIAHSITLCLSALNLIHVPIAPVEACIALSILFLAVEIYKHHQHKDSLTYRHPVLVSSSFGLLHGLGFAAVLTEIGLPVEQLVTALLFFNVGVELGQILFIFVCFACLYLLTVIFNKEKTNFLANGKMITVGTYLIGTLAAFWFFDRLF